jgi:DNA invertase Pin-like site-specific DNA recombinase
MGKIYAYTRVSKDEQDLNNQKLEIESYATAKKIEIEEWIEIKASSRKNSKDRRLDELLGKLKKGDTLVVSEVSRLARSIRQVHNIIYEIAKKKVELHLIKQNIVTSAKGENDMATKIYINALAQAAEIERDLISQRTKNGLARVKAEGKKLGNPNLKADNQIRIDKANEYAETLRATISSFIKSGFTQRQMVDELNRIGVKTARGCDFTLVTLQRVMKRLNLSTVHSNKHS